MMSTEVVIQHLKAKLWLCPRDFNALNEGRHVILCPSPLPTVATPLRLNNGCCDDVVNMIPIAQENEL
jgi:hypothetical protein